MGRTLPDNYFVGPYLKILDMIKASDISVRTVKKATFKGNAK